SEAQLSGRLGHQCEYGGRPLPQDANVPKAAGRDHFGVAGEAESPVAGDHAVFGKVNAPPSACLTAMTGTSDNSCAFSASEMSSAKSFPRCTGKRSVFVKTSSS